MIQISVTDTDKSPIYQQIADQISRDIALGGMVPGYQLPTVRELALKTGISQGTIKHAYDILEQGGLIKKTRGSGTFVNLSKGQTGGEGTKAQALQAIDSFLDRMRDLSFSPHDIRIFLDLKLREREEDTRHVTVSAVDCSPEALSVMYEQVLGMPHTEVYKFLLDDVLEAPRQFDPATDLVVTTPTHYEDLTHKMPPGRQPIRLVMAIATDTALQLAAIPPETTLGIVCVSKRFAQVMFRACDEYCHLDHPVSIAYLGEENSIKELAGQCNRLLLPPNYSLFAGQAEGSILETCKKSHNPIHYRYEVERGSLLYLEEQISRIYRANRI
jgi:DNA-binding transcriptional regulator YhcF (GntR family)